MHKPSLSYGLRLSLRLWPLLAALWIAPIIFFAPFRVMISTSAGRALGMIPGGFTPPPGDIGLLGAHAVFPILPELGIALLSGLLLMWAFTILWHAGVCRWLIWDQGAPVSVPSILGHGFLSWFSYLRLSLFAFFFFVLVVGGTNVGFLALARQSWEKMQEDRMVLLLLAASILAAILKIILWAATLRGAWELALPHSRSSLLAWFRGLRGVIRQPIATLLPTAIMGLLITALLVLPLYLSIVSEHFRNGWQSWALFIVSSLAAAFLQLWLYTTMAPITGLGNIKGD